MRGGPLADRRVIRLLNRRFVSFYFNVGSGQPGFDPIAHEVISTIDDRFAGTSVPTPPVWILTPDLGSAATIDNYTVKDDFFQELTRILNKYPGLARTTPDEAVLTGLDAAVLAEDLGRYERAIELYTELEDPEAWLGRARIARYTEKWDAAAEALLQLDEEGDEWADQVAVERAHAHLARKEYEEAHELLLAALLDYPKSLRLGEMHFYAGVAAFFLDKRDWANLHWCWVMENLPDDNQYMRCYLATAADAMPYPNPELGGYKSSASMISHALADKARAAARKDYERLLPELERLREG